MREEGDDDTFYPRCPRRRAIIKEDYALIPLGPFRKNGHSIVDLDDIWVDEYLWTEHSGYALGMVERTRMNLHGLIAGKIPGKFVDHINGNTLDNRRKNLRVVDPVINSLNRGPDKSNKSGMVGVRWDTRQNKWQTYICFNGRFYYLGHFLNLYEARRRRNIAKENLIQALLEEALDKVSSREEVRAVLNKK